MARKETKVKGQGIEETKKTLKKETIQSTEQSDITVPQPTSLTKQERTDIVADNTIADSADTITVEQSVDKMDSTDIKNNENNPKPRKKFYNEVFGHTWMGYGFTE